MAAVAQPARNWLRSGGAVLAGFATVVFLSTGIDVVMHALHVFPPLDQPMTEPGDNALALAYRLVVTVLGGWVTARLAAFSPMGHAIALAVLGLLPGVAGVVFTWNLGLGPHWYPIALALLSPLAVLLGGWLVSRRAGQGAS